MIRFLEIPDLHFDDAWIDTIEMILNKARKIAQECNVNFVVFPGDMHNRNTYITKQYNRFRLQIKYLLTVCPVCSVVGTPGHETESLYGPLEDIGLVLLRPNHVYGYESYTNTIEPEPDFDNVDCLLFGIPELSKQSIMATLSVSADEANATAEDAFRRYIAEFIAPNRVNYSSLPAIGVMHGAVSDCARDNETDEKRKHSAILPSTDDLAVAGMDRWSLGHIHTPWESKKISAGYAGSWGQSWNETGFEPAINLVEIDESRRVTIKRIPYGTPKRFKLIAPLKEYERNIAYWLDTEDTTITLPDTVHPWSRVTHTIERNTTQRITKEQKENARTLADLFKLFDPTVSDTVLEKVRTLEQAECECMANAVDVRLDRVKVQGCTFFAGKTVELDIKSMPSGITAIMGGNGSGKSSILSFCSLYPVIIGKPTPSGKQSAIAPFFSSPDSRIDKWATVNGRTHHHIATIKGAHTKTPKVEYFLYIDDTPQLEKGTFDEMFAKCEELYGSFSDYLATTFYIQPLQGDSRSSLMSATMTDIRDLVQSIAGIDRSREKETALETVRRIESEIKELESWITGAKTFSVDVAEIEQRIESYDKERAQYEFDLVILRGNGTKKREEVESLKKKARDSELETERMETDAERRAEKEAKLTVNLKTIESLAEKARRTIENRIALQLDDERIARMTKRQDIINGNARIEAQYKTELSEWTEKLNAERERIRKINAEQERLYNTALAEYVKRKSELESIIEHAGKPCWNCGVLPKKGSEAQVKEAALALHLLTAPSKTNSIPLPETIPGKPSEPSLAVIPAIENPAIDRKAVEQSIIDGDAAKARIIAIEQENVALNHEIEDYKLRKYNIDQTISVELEKEERELETMRQQYADKEARAKSLSELRAKEYEAIEKAKNVTNEIAAKERTLDVNRLDLVDWKYIASNLQPAKLPAMELELFAAAIDEEATRIISPLESSRYSFTTETQAQGKSGTIDRFDIKINDNETGSSKSFLAHSPGEKAFFNDAYVKALVKIRNERSHRTYSPIIQDESDGPIQPERIAQYYDIQKDFYSGSDCRVLIVSHSPTAHSYVDSKVDIDSIKRPV